MKKFYDTVSIFCILLITSILFNFLFYSSAELSVISYGVIFQYAVIILLAQLIFECVPCLPLKNAALIYLVTAALISLETVLLECVVWNWLEPTLLNLCFLSAWVFVTCGIFTVIFIRKNIADAKRINQCLEKWKSENRSGAI